MSDPGRMSSAPVARQFVLDVTLPEGSDFEGFHPGANALALDGLRDLARGCGELQIYVYGETGTGKTHLLQAVCHEAAQQGRRAAYLPQVLLAGAGARSLDGLDALDVVCLDGIGVLCGSPEGETALFNLINEARARGTQLVLSDRQSPRALCARLSDLASRLVWGPVFQLAPMDDDAKCALLVAWARRRGFELPREVGDYLLRTCPRDLPSLLAQVRRLERESLGQQRRVTLPFARAVIQTGEDM
jgi:DnaA-homolog protein